jgi:hypothetical protein
MESASRIQSCSSINVAKISRWQMLEESQLDDCPRPGEDCMHVLATYLELALNTDDACVVIVEPRNDACGVYVGNPWGAEGGLELRGTLSTAVTDGVLEITTFGENELVINGQRYRFFRSFVQLALGSAVAFSIA